MKKLSYITILVVLMFVGVLSVNAETLYGDVNQDGEVNAKDANVLKDYLEGDTSVINEDGLKAADVYKDSKINDNDSLVLRRHIAGWNSFKTLPVSTSTVLYRLGDVNQDGKLTEEDKDLITGYIRDNNTLTGDEIFLADVNEDGKVNALDKTALSALMNEDNENTNGGSGTTEENEENANTGDEIMYIGVAVFLLASIMVISYKKSHA